MTSPNSHGAKHASAAPTGEAQVDPSATPPPALSGWQPIETLPFGVGEVLVAWRCAATGEQLLSIAEQDYKGRWISDGDGLLYPTHWMPLPTPPEAA